MLSDWLIEIAAGIFPGNWLPKNPPWLRRFLVGVAVVATALMIAGLIAWTLE